MVNSLLIAILCARLASVTYYGVYQLTFAILAVLGLVALASSGAAVTRAAAQGRTVAWPVFRARVPYCVATSMLLVCSGAVLYLSGNSQLGASLLAISVTIPFFLGADVYPAYLLGERRWMDYLRFQLAVQTATAVAVAGAVVVAPGDPWVAVFAVGTITGVVQFARLWLLRAVTSPAERDIAYAKQVTALSVLPAIDGRLDILVTGALLSAREAGLVAIARSLPLLTKRVWEVLYQPFFVKMSAIGPLENLRVVRRYRLPLFAVLGSGSLVAAALAPVLIPAVFGVGGRGAVTLAQLLLIATAVTVFGLLDEVLLRAQGDLRRLRIVLVVLPVISMVAMPVLVYLLGIDGVGVEAVIVAIVYVSLVRRLAARSVAATGRQEAVTS
jgi:O-antigen/teichoic acid export membrane protein